MFDNIAIIAGSGNLPFKIATYLKKLNSKFIVLSIKGFSNIKLYKSFKSYSLRMGEGYKAIKILKENNIKKIVFLGGLERPSLKTLRPDLWTFFKVFSFIFFKKTDDVILRNVISIFENEGFQVIGLSNITDKYFLKKGMYGYRNTVPKRDKIIKKLKKNNIQININYPFPIHKMKAYKNRISNKSNYLPITEKMANGIFSLPLYPKLKVRELLKITRILKVILLKI